jgi:quercetin dioxygenase-like cupin family protein
MTTPTTAVHAARRTPNGSHVPTDLTALGEELLREAATLASARTAHTLTPGAGSPLKQTVLALRAGAALQEHVAPGPATLLVLEGEVVLVAGTERHVATRGTWLVIPAGPHALEATTDAVALITVVSEHV